jgi:hypothetical protein
MDSVDLLRSSHTVPGAAMLALRLRRRRLCLFGEHRSEIMFGVLVVILCGDRIAMLRFGAGQRQILLIASLQVLKAPWFGS